VSTINAATKRIRKQAVLHAVVLFATLLDPAKAQNAPACQAGIDQDKNTIAKIGAAREKHSNAITSDDSCDQFKASKEMLTLTKARISIRNQIAIDCEGLHQTDGTLIVERNKEIMHEVVKTIQSLEKQTIDEHEDCQQAGPSPPKPDPGAFDLNSPGMLRCQASLNRCRSDAQSSLSYCNSSVCQSDNACLIKCSNDYGTRLVRCTTYGKECFKDPNHDDSKLLSAIWAPLQ
jgi:hypothetical protein